MNVYRSGATLLAAAALVVAALSGCGGGSENAQPRAAETNVQQEDQAYAESIVLRLSDFPAGWRVEESADESEGSMIDLCAHLDFSNLVMTGRAESETFSYGTMLMPSATSQAVVFADSAELAFEQMASRETATCLRDALEEEARTDPPEDAEIGTITVGEIPLGSVGEKSRAYQIVVKVEADELSQRMYMDFVYIFKGHAVAVLHFLDALTPFDNDFELAKTVASRM